MARKEDSTGGTTPATGEAVQAVAGVGGVRSSDDSAPDLWFGEPAEERRDATCSAGEKRREGRGDGPRGLRAPDKVRQLQITLYRKAKSKPEYRFWSLYGEVQRGDVLAAAWGRVKANAGAAGVDGITIEELAADAQVEAAWLATLREELHRKTYRPAEEEEGNSGGRWVGEPPVRRVKIPKARGGFRPLGIPTVKDRARPPAGLPIPLLLLGGADGGVFGVEADLRGGLSSALLRLSPWTQRPSSSGGDPRRVAHR